MATGMSGGYVQPGMIGYPGSVPNPAQRFKDPATGAAEEFPTAGVDPSQLYDTASKSAMSKQNFEQGQKAADAAVGRLPAVFNAVTGVGGGAGQVQYGTGTSAANPATLQAAQEAAFARAKDQSGLIAKSAITGLRDSMAGRGMLGSGQEGEETAAVINQGANQLGDVNRTQLEDALTQAQHQADVTYQGGIAQRGQSLQAVQGLLAALTNAGRVY